MTQTRQADSRPLLAPHRRKLAGLISPVFEDPKHRIRIYQGDCLEILPHLPEDSFDLIFADPSYFRWDDLQRLHPNDLHSRDKIRQQLQRLRDLGLLKFLGGGTYRVRV